MRKLLFVVPFILVSCSSPILTSNDAMAFDYDIPTSVQTPLQVAEWVRDTIPYRADEEGKDYWQMPQETLDRGFGDCEDRTILILAILNMRRGSHEGLYLDLYWMSSGALHAVAYDNGTTYDIGGNTQADPHCYRTSHLDWSSLGWQIALKQEASK